MTRHTRDGPINVDAIAELMNKLNKRCGAGAVRLVIAARIDPDRVVTREDGQELRQLESIIVKLFSEISPDQLKLLEG